METAIKRAILESLLTPPRWGGRHTEIKNIKRSLTSSVLSTKDDQKALENAIKEMINDGWLLVKKSTGETHVSLNPRKKREIMQFVLSS